MKSLNPLVRPKTTFSTVRLTRCFSSKMVGMILANWTVPFFLDFQISVQGPVYRGVENKCANSQENA